MEQANPTWRIPLADVDLGPEEEAAVLDVLRRGWLSMGEVTAAFEAEFAALTGARHALAVTNCTAALHLAGLALGWGPGDEVIVPSLTFVATANAVRYTGATPIFADISSESDFSLSAEDVAERITPRTKAITVVHYAGHAADMGAILALAERHGLAVVEDVAHAPGGDLDDRALGTWGNIGCFSFFANKNMTTGEGGMMTTDDDELAARLRLLRSHGMTSLTWDRHKGHAWSYDVVAPGYNYRIDEVRAAIGRVQLAKVTAANKRRRALDALYRELLPAVVPELGVPYSSTRGTPACHLRPVLLPPGADRRRFMDEMKARGIQTSIHYPPIHRFSYYRDAAGATTLPLTDLVGEREVTLPLYPALTTADVESVVAAVAEALDAAMDGVGRPLAEMTALFG
jgi:dTDP-4-amino-4,6-dideoxygalactose transaminase